MCRTWTIQSKHGIIWHFGKETSADLTMNMKNTEETSSMTKAGQVAQKRAERGEGQRRLLTHWTTDGSNLTCSLRLRIHYSALLRDVNTIQELSDILIFHCGCLLDEGS